MKFVKPLMFCQILINVLFMTNMANMHSKKVLPHLMEVSTFHVNYINYMLWCFLEKIGGGYFMRQNPYALFDKFFNGTNPWLE